MMVPVMLPLALELKWTWSATTDPPTLPKLLLKITLNDGARIIAPVSARIAGGKSLVAGSVSIG
jgi:hypothetical protein